MNSGTHTFFRDVKTEELQAELKRREEEAAKKKMVIVRCPVCVDSFPDYVKKVMRLLGVPEMCAYCNGTKQIQAELIESK